MSDPRKLELDGEKLKYYPNEVGGLQSYLEDNSEEVPVPAFWPLTLELSPWRACNFRCCYCAMDYRRAAGPHSMDAKVLDGILESPAPAKPGIVWAGEGEPTLWPHFSRMVSEFSRRGFRQGLATNGTYPGILEYLKRFVWVRFSVDALDPVLYNKIHGVDGVVRAKVFELIEAAASRNATAVGVQSVVFEENAGDVLRLARFARELGATYFVAKPYSHHPASTHQTLTSPSGELLDRLALELGKLSTDTFAAVWRGHAVDAVSRSPGFQHCWAAPFFGFVDSTGAVYNCVQFVGLDRETLGNLTYQTYHEIVTSERWRRAMKEFLWRRPVSECRRGCRLYAANEYLDRLLSRDPHQAFI